MADFALPFLLGCFGLILIMSPQTMALTMAATRRHVVGRSGGGFARPGRTSTLRFTGILAILYAIVLVVLQAP